MTSTEVRPTAEGGAAADGGFGFRFKLPLLMAACLNPVNSSIIATAMVPIAQALDVPVGRTALLVTALYIASAVAQPAMGKVGQHVGARRTLMAGAAIVIIGGLVGLFGTSLAALVIARVLLGVGTSAGFPTAMMMIRRRASESGQSPSKTLGSLVVSSQVTVLFGLPVGGLLVSSVGWRATFWVNIPLALAVLLTAWRWSPVDRPRSTKTGVTKTLRALDVVGMVLFAGVLTSLVSLMVSLPHLNGGLLLVTAALGVVLITWETRPADPFIDFEQLAANLPLAGTYVRTSGIMLVAYTVMYGVTQWLQEDRHLSATAAGLLIVPMSATGAIVTRLVASRGLVRAPLIWSAALALGAGVTLWFIDHDTPLALIVVLTSVAGIAVGLASYGNQSAAYAQADPDALGVAAGLLRTSGYIGAIASGSLVAVVFRDGSSDSGLHTISEVLIPVSAIILAMTALARTLPAKLAPTAGHD